MSTDDRIANLLSDDPRDGSSERPDELGRGAFVGYLRSLLDGVRSQSESTVMALIGDWGSGKSSVLELLEKQLTLTTWLVGTFNPWTYADKASLQRGFFSELAAALPENGRPSSARAKIGDLARTVSPLGKLGGIVGVDGEGIIHALADIVVGDTSASAAKRVAETALRRVHRPLLMVIDDLDRLTPDELLEVLKLVRLIGRLPHVYYLLCYDERTLLDVLQQTPLAGGSEGRARAYLEKIVQVRLDMPALLQPQRASLLNRGLDAILSENSVVLTRAEEERLGDVYFSVLDRRLNTPRSITRFLGQVQAFFPPLRGEVDFVDFFLVSWLRTQEPGIYTMLQRDRDALLGRRRGDWGIGRRDEAAAKERQAFWVERVKAAQVNPVDQDGVLRVLAGLFPEVEAAFASAQYYASSTDSERPRAISNADYFDRYVTFGVPDDDLPDSIVHDALGDLTASTMSDALKRFTEELTTHTERAVRKLNALRDAGTPLPEPEIFELLAEVWPNIEPFRTELFSDPRGSVERAAALCLLNVDSHTSVEIAKRVAAHADQVPFVISVVRRLHGARTSPYSSTVPDDYDLTPLREISFAAAQQLHERSEVTSPFDPGIMGQFWALNTMDAARASEWLRAQVDTGRWTLLDTVGALTSTATSIGGGGRTFIGEFEVSVVDQVFTLDRVFGELERELRSAEPFRGDPHDIDATPATRIAYALSALKQALEQRGRSEGTEAGQD